MLTELLKSYQSNITSPSDLQDIRMAPPTLYSNALSTPSRFVRLIANIIGVELKIVNIKEITKEMRTPEMLEKFPQHKIPALEDNGLFISESRAIAMYLVSKYGKDDSLYPKDLNKRVLVDQRLFFDVDLYSKITQVFVPKFHGKQIEPNDIDKPKEGLETLDRMLDGKQWLAGDNVTIVDYSIANCLLSLELNPESGVDPNMYPNIKEWLSRVETSNPKYVEHIKEFRENVKQLLQRRNT
ncbi:glutathione S-transferase 1-like isoform X2 [Schistocerca gregaria]|uniref:glutathione S-transferase 1-like isoform X2 n=1 Tax=Schistocerca gregaria TaxID=7010 RepID=UPI00211F2B0D|nr:glutathione S-transferase 1-like isoform X2 [Schistocerca gregaria]